MRLELAGIGDLCVTLVEEEAVHYYAVAPEQCIRNREVVHFNEFAKRNYWRKWGTCSGTHKIQLLNITEMNRVGCTTLYSPIIFGMVDKRIGPGAGMGPDVASTIDDIIVSKA